MGDNQNTEPKTVCGVVMPISELDGCSEDHWTEVHDILTEAIEAAGFEANLVSNADDVGIIQKRIIQNLYDNPIVVCDVSGKNPNVMFELGLRLAFDRPTIIVKDDKTSYTFDTSPIEHLEYPRDLRFAKIVDFKSTLAEKIKNTFEKASKDPNYTTFLKHFGEFKVAKIDQKEVSAQEFIIDELKNIRLAVSRLDRQKSLGKGLESRFRDRKPDLDICGMDVSKQRLAPIVLRFLERPEVSDIDLDGADGHAHLQVYLKPGSDPGDLENTIAHEISKEYSRPPNKVKRVSRKTRSTNGKT